ncbi:helix-turn-helix transcriptional regulator [Brenneria goodwinii]|nr:helix-turn-helix transcriptional regulator [Brenneria goodwinii]MCG8163348.1 helix-turn-helix transcriptional regulator [Brenneria goodwinii]MCG8165143.1 helix-turn-helix transcriptional regulator [Brenneria goodwinii]MCG8170889.1 helix-turn-helix transcriptional regulator [Brenneria goodwinii]MCG8175910.1 helix-turn-helix transcriptional regulator [Brenneria goodwinii]
MNNNPVHRRPIFRLICGHSLFPESGVRDEAGYTREAVPPHVEYCLTPLGKEASERVKILADWIEENLTAILAAQETYSDK